VVVTNDHVGFWDLAGSPLYTRWIWPVSSPAEKGFFNLDTDFVADPEVVYDPYADRWWITMFANGVVPGTFGFVLAMSDDGNPSGPPLPTPPAPPSEGVWYRWYHSDDAGPLTNNFDSPNITVDADFVYITGVLRDSSDVLAHRIYAIPKTALLSGTVDPSTPLPLPTPQVVSFPINGNRLNAAGLVQRDTADASPQYTIEAFGDKTNPDVIFDKIELRAFKFFTGGGAPIVSSVEIAMPPGYHYKAPIAAPQLNGAGHALQIHDARFWGMPVYVSGSIWACHTITPASGEATNLSQWMQVSTNGWPTSGNLPTLAQVGRIGGDGRHAIFPSLAVNAGQTVVTYCEASAAAYVKIRRAYRRSTDTPGTMPFDDEVKASNTPWLSPNPPFVFGGDRWGDYSATERDRSRRCFVWGTHEYVRDESTTDPTDQHKWRVWVERYNLCPTDFDGNGEIEPNDLLVFAELYAKGDPAADVNQDKSLDAQDLMIVADTISKGLP
jgi:hypothetical protein